MSRDKNDHLRLADRPADYQNLGIDPVEVAQFEDGQRIGTEKGRYEWWYFDAHLDNGEGGIQSDFRCLKSIQPISSVWAGG